MRESLFLIEVVDVSAARRLLLPKILSLIVATNPLQLVVATETINLGSVFSADCLLKLQKRRGRYYGKVN
jgi:hypothetical protein